MVEKASNDVLRRNAEDECGTPVGQVNIMLKRGIGSKSLETISFYCNKRRLHTDQCAFEGNDVVITARRSPLRRA